MKFEELQMIRESCRVYSDKKVSREDLTHLVDVARFSPSDCNSQPWKFIIIDEEDAREKVILLLMTMVLQAVLGEIKSLLL